MNSAILPKHHTLTTVFQSMTATTNFFRIDDQLENFKIRITVKEVLDLTKTHRLIIVTFTFHRPLHGLLSLMLRNKQHNILKRILSCRGNKSYLGQCEGYNCDACELCALTPQFCVLKRNGRQYQEERKSWSHTGKDNNFHPKFWIMCLFQDINADGFASKTEDNLNTTMVYTYVDKDQFRPARVRDNHIAELWCIVYSPHPSQSPSAASTDIRRQRQSFIRWGSASRPLVLARADVRRIRRRCRGFGRKGWLSGARQW